MPTKDTHTQNLEEVLSLQLPNVWGELQGSQVIAAIKQHNKNVLL